MLKILSASYTPELLHTLAAMGHGDEIALVDSNYPAVSRSPRIVRLGGATLADTLDSCLQLPPWKTF